jgi:hypothetical protein
VDDSFVCNFGGGLTEICRKVCYVVKRQKKSHV